VYAVRGETVFVNLFVASQASFEVAGAPLSLVQTTGYPWDGRVELRVDPGQPRAFELRVRVPGWARGTPVPSELYRYLDGAPAVPVLHVNGEPVEGALSQGYQVIARTWKPGDIVSVELPMPVRRVLADERVADDRGKAALERGPLVYCAEGADNGGSVLDVALPDDAPIEVERRTDLLGGVTTLRASAVGPGGAKRQLTAIPYYAWSHRGPGEMAVWLPRKPAASAAATAAASPGPTTR
jgi:DUF1680 family protein